MATVDAYLDPITNDLPAVNRLITGLDLVLQRIRIRLNRNRGEWFIDITAGVPLLDWLAHKPPRLGEIAAFIRSELDSIPGVAGTDEFRSSFDTATRTVRITGVVFTETGDVTTISVESSQAQVGDNPAFWTVFFSAAGA